MPAPPAPRSHEPTHRRPRRRTRLQRYRAASSGFVERGHHSGDRGLGRYVTEQPNYSTLQRGVESHVLPAAEEHGLGVLAWSPIASASSPRTGPSRQRSSGPALWSISTLSSPPQTSPCQQGSWMRSTKSSCRESTSLPRRRTTRPRRSSTRRCADSRAGVRVAGYVKSRMPVYHQRPPHTFADSRVAEAACRWARQTDQPMVSTATPAKTMKIGRST